MIAVPVLQSGPILKVNPQLEPQIGRRPFLPFFNFFVKTFDNRLFHKENASAANWALPLFFFRGVLLQICKLFLGKKKVLQKQERKFERLKSSFSLHCKTLPFHLPKPDCSIITLLSGGRHRLTSPLILPPPIKVHAKHVTYFVGEVTTFKWTQRTHL